ncbi:MAG: hypothetical protein CL790_02520 [Chloroflexi bacterium]|nr:hypothetical protein [Chloroflexota bacterium]
MKLLLVAAILIFLGPSLKEVLGTGTEWSHFSLRNKDYGMPKNERSLIESNRKRAEKGDALSQLQLGLLYANGHRLKQNDRMAIKWLEKAAEKGLSDAFYNLGVIYDIGKGVEENNEQAVKMYLEAAHQGNAKAQTNLGVMYFLGEGVKDDPVAAYTWWNIATANGNDTAKGHINIITGEMTKEQIAKAQELAQEMIEANPKLLGVSC